MLECSTSMPFNWASKDSVFSVHFIVALLDFESREYMYYYYILLGYCGGTTESDQLGRYRSGWVKRGNGGRGNKKEKTSIILPDQWKEWSPIMVNVLHFWSRDPGLSPSQDSLPIQGSSSCVPAGRTPKNVCVGGYSSGHCVVFLGETLYTLTEPYST